MADCPDCFRKGTREELYEYFKDDDIARFRCIVCGHKYQLVDTCYAKAAKEIASYIKGGVLFEGDTESEAQ